MLSVCRKFLNALSALIFVLTLPCPVAAQSPADSTRDFARKIVATTGPQRSVALTVRNLSSMAEADYAALSRVLADELLSNTLRIVAPAEGVIEVRTTLSENTRGFLWVAQVRIGEKEQVVMEAFARSAVEEIDSEPLILQKKRLWEQEAPMLDVALSGPIAGDGARMLVLEPGRVALYERAGNEWTAVSSQPIRSAAPLPRDPRGRIELESGVFTLYLPGQECAGAIAPQLSLDCRAVGLPESNWTLRSGADDFLVAQFDATRNSFTGVLYPASRAERGVSPFYSVAIFGARDTLSFLFAGTDGVARLVGRSAIPQAAFTGWGSELAAIHSPCADAPLALASRAKDWMEADGLQAFRIDGSQATPASTIAEFSGPVTALWSTPDDTLAMAIVRNLKTGRYEAYALTLICSQ